jgi:hypothetical protein
MCTSIGQPCLSLQHVAFDVNQAEPGQVCVFGVTTGKLLGFLVSYQRIEANPEKIKTIEAM